MKINDFIEALQATNKLFQEKHGVPLEIFDLKFHEDDFDGDMKIYGCKEVVYEDDTFGYGEVHGKKPLEKLRVHFECENGHITDRTISIEDDD